MKDAVKTFAEGIKDLSLKTQVEKIMTTNKEADLLKPKFVRIEASPAKKGKDGSPVVEESDIWDEVEAKDIFHEKQ